MAAEPTTTLLIIRHGETVWNVENRFQGHGDSPLTRTGCSQALAVGRRLKSMTFDTLICSDLGRAQTTAECIAQPTGHAIQSDSRLRERNYGILEGLTVAEISARYPQVWTDLQADDPDYVIPGGESQRQHFQRNIGFFEAYIATHAGSTAALVVHGGVMDSIFRYVARLPLSQPRCFTTANTSLNIVSHGPFHGTIRWVIGTWGDVSHLDDIGRQ
jgi:probable phosphoglycerate mutase